MHDSNHNGVVRIFAGHSYVVNIKYLDYAAQFFPYQEYVAIMCSG